jgi:transposase
VVKVAKQEGRRMPDELTRALGLVGLRVTGVREQDGDALEVEVEGLERAERCPPCDATQLEIKERPIVGVQDLPLAGRRTRLCWRKRRYRCRSCGRTHTERHPGLPSRQRVSARLRARLAVRAAVGGAHAEIAREEGTSRYQVTRALALVAVAPATGLRRISFDEAHHRRGRELATVVSDLDRRRVVEVLDGRSQKVVARYLRGLGEEARLAIEVVSIDPYEAYRQAIWAELPGARIVCDRFHLVRGANTALDAVRRERQRVEAGRRPKGARRSGKGGSWRPELYRARRVLLKARERLSERERRRLCELFATDPVIGEAWGLKEAFRAIYRAADRVEAEVRLEAFLAAVGRAGLPSFEAFAAGIRQWREELLAYFEEPTTNGYAEGVINKVKVIKRRAYGLPSFRSFRHRVLVACG